MVLRIEQWIKEGKGFMLRDEYLIDDPSSGGHGEMSDLTWTGKFRGRMIALYPDNYHNIDINPSTYPGRFSSFWAYLTISVAYSDALIIKFDEEISFGNPTHQKFMQMLEHQEEQLEAKIKQGLVTISQSVADLELLEHDIRKYKEYKRYIDDYFSNPPEDDEEGKKRKKLADRVLKMIFVEQVDYHVGSIGQGPGRFSMAFLRNNNLMPTIVDDFLEIERIEDIDELLYKQKKISGAERNVLITKFKAFQEWLTLFKEAVETRLKRLEELKRSREKTLEEFKEWVKPHIIRLKALRMRHDLSTSSPAGQYHYKKFPRFTQITGIYRYIGTLWIIKDLILPWDRMEYRKSLSRYDFSANPHEPYYDDPLNPYNKWTQENLVFNYDYGLLADYPWITKEFADDSARKAWGFLSKRKYVLYYIFAHVTVKNDIYHPIELEDIDFIFNPILLSHNAVLVKLIENDAHTKEFDMEVEEFIGHISRIPGKSIATYYKSGGKFIPTPRFAEKWIYASPNTWVYKIHRERIEETRRRLKERNITEEDLRRGCEMSKNEFYYIFDKENFYHVKNFRENKFISFLEDKIFGHSLKWRFGKPYITSFKDATTYIFYRTLYYKVNNLLIEPILKLMNLPE